MAGSPYPSRSASRIQTVALTALDQNLPLGKTQASKTDEQHGYKTRDTLEGVAGVAGAARNTRSRNTTDKEIASRSKQATQDVGAVLDPGIQAFWHRYNYIRELEKNTSIKEVLDPIQSKILGLCTLPVEDSLNISLRGPPNPTSKPVNPKTGLLLRPDTIYYTLFQIAETCCNQSSIFQPDNTGYVSRASDGKLLTSRRVTIREAYPAWAITGLAQVNNADGMSSEAIALSCHTAVAPSKGILVSEMLVCQKMANSQYRSRTCGEANRMMVSPSA